MNDHVISPSRRPIVIADSQLSTGDTSTSVRADDVEALLRDYLRLIRRVRNQQRARNIALRRVDIEALARHLDWTDDQVLARLADLMGATRRQRATMLAVLSTGAALITVASPLSAAASTTEHTALEQTEPPVVIDADEITKFHPGTGRPLGRPTDDSAEIPRRAPVLELQADLASFPHTAAVHEFAPTKHDETTEPTPAPTPGSPSTAAVANAPAIGPGGDTVAVGRAPVPPPATETGTDSAGNTVAVGQPPVPPPSADTGTDPDGNTVAVGQPPVPPAPQPSDAPTPDTVTQSAVVESEASEPEAVTAVTEGEPSATGTDPDGNTVAVGQPPVPPPPAETGTDPDGNTVAVGQPPVPPTPDA